MCINAPDRTSPEHYLLSLNSSRLSDGWFIQLFLDGEQQHGSVPTHLIKERQREGEREGSNSRATDKLWCKHKHTGWDGDVAATSVWWGGSFYIQFEWRDCWLLALLWWCCSLPALWLYFKHSHSHKSSRHMQRPTFSECIILRVNEFGSCALIALRHGVRS